MSVIYIEMPLKLRFKAPPPSKVIKNLFICLYLMKMFTYSIIILRFRPNSAVAVKKAERR